MQEPPSPIPNTALPTDKELALRVVPMPADCNANGDIFGGWVMAQVDMAGSISSVRVAKGRIATVAVNQILFKQSVKVGDLLSFYSQVVRVGKTSITTRVEVYAERIYLDRSEDDGHSKREVIKVTEAELTYVAIDKTGKPRPIAPRPSRP